MEGISLEKVPNTLSFWFNPTKCNSEILGQEREQTVTEGEVKAQRQG